MFCKYLDDQRKEINANDIKKQMSVISNQETKPSDEETVKELFNTERQKVGRNDCKARLLL
jgi:hypothetical protein